MSIVKLLFISMITLGICFVTKIELETPIKSTQFNKGNQWSNRDKAFQFEVTENGQMIRFELAGNIPMNNWKTVEMEIFDQNERYLFTYRDELWSESGRDSDGAWTERKTHTSIEQRFPNKGIYTAYITENSGPEKRAQFTSFSFRAVAIKGDSSKLVFLMWVCVIVFGICFLIIINRYESNKEKVGQYRPKKKNPYGKKEKLKTWPFILIFLVPTAFLSVWAFQNDDSDVDWLMLSYSKNNMVVDRQLRQQSLSGAKFRSGGSTGGK